VFELANAAYQQVVGHRQLVGLRVADALPEVVGQGFLDLLDTVRRTGEPFVGRGVPIWLQKTPGAPLTEAFLDFVYQPIRGADGEVVGIFAQGHDITEQKRVEKALERQTQFLSLAQEAGGVGTFEWDLATNLVSGSPAFLRLYGIDPERGDLPITEFAKMVHPEDRGLLVIAPSPSMDEGFRRTEYRVITPSGIRWIARQAVVVRNKEGEPERVLGAAFDLTERKDAELQLSLIAQESAHRIKNMLAMVHAITTQTLRTSPSLPEARDAIGARLVALGQAQDLLTHGSVAAGIADVVAASTQLHSETFGRFRAQGPNLELSPKAVLALGLMLHELATNALKYGALSLPGGGVEITWSERREDAETGAAFVDWEWREWGGPPVQEPTQKGFGSRLIERGLASNLGRAELIYAPTGLVCRARIAVARVAVG
jgi:two-component sensor histidine kinase